MSAQTHFLPPSTGRGGPYEGGDIAHPKIVSPSSTSRGGVQKREGGRRKPTASCTKGSISLHGFIWTEFPSNSYGILFVFGFLVVVKSNKRLQEDPQGAVFPLQSTFLLQSVQICVVFSVFILLTEMKNTERFARVDFTPMDTYKPSFALIRIILYSFPNLRLSHKLFY